MQDVADICIALMDCDRNEVPRLHFPEPHIPVLKLFVKGGRGSIVYDGPRDLPNFVQFIARHTGLF